MNVTYKKVSRCLALVVIGVVSIEYFDQVSIGIFFMMWANNVGK